MNTIKELEKAQIEVLILCYCYDFPPKEHQSEEYTKEAAVRHYHMNHNFHRFVSRLFYLLTISNKKPEKTLL